VQWPAGIEGFDLAINDSLDKTQVPLKGSRTFRFPFIAGKAGNYIIPAISFTFFDPDSNKYKTTSAAVPEIRISNEEKEATMTIRETNSQPKKSSGIVWWAAGGVLFILVIALLWFIFRRRKKEILTEASLQEIVAPVRIDELLQPAQFALMADDGRFYSLLQKSIWDHLSNRLKLSGSKINKDELYKAMKEKNLDENQYHNILGILQQCEAAVFTKAEFADDKQELLNRTKSVLEQIKI
jgi:hypothetical protein